MIRSTRFKMPAILFGSAMTFIHLNLHAEDQLAETIYVSATRSETTPLPVASQIVVIDQQQIKNSGATLVTEVLRNQMGIQWTDSDGSGSRNVTVSMRGLSGANNVLVLVDGRKLNNASMAAPALNTIAIDDVERIEIMQGSAGVLYGDQAVAGVINIITKRAKSNQLQADLNLTAGSFSLMKSDFSLRQGLDNGLSYSLSLQDRRSDNYRDNNNSLNQNYLGNLRYTGSQGFIYAEVQTVNDNLRLSGALTEAAAQNNPRSTTHPKDFSDQDNNIYRLGGGFDFTEHWQLLTDYANRDEKIDGNLSGMFNQKLKQQNISPRAVGKWAMNGGEFVTTLGVDAVDATYTIGSTFGTTHATQTQRDIYGQVILPLSAQFNVTAGARESTVDDKAHLVNYLGDQTKQKSQSASSSELGINYQVAQGVQLFSRVAQGFRYANADDYTYALKGFDFLLPQKSLSKEVGTQVSKGDLKLTASIYQMDLDNEIAYDPDSYANVNLPSSTRSGLTTQIYYALAESVDLQANYTYTRARISAGTFKNKWVPYVAKNAANAGANFHWTKAINLWIGAEYLGARYRSGDDNNSQGVLDSRTIWNANLCYELTSQLAAALKINNITNEHYAASEGYSSYSGKYEYPQPGRNYALTISYYF